MRNKLGTIVVIAVALLESVPGARADSPRVVHKQYVGAPTSAGLVFCGASPSVAIPAGTTHLDVEVGDRVGAEQPRGRLTAGTVGYVTARFS